MVEKLVWTPSFIHMFKQLNINVIKCSFWQWHIWTFPIFHADMNRSWIFYLFWWSFSSDIRIPRPPSLRMRGIEPLHMGIPNCLLLSFLYIANIFSLMAPLITTISQENSDLYHVLFYMSISIRGYLFFFSSRRSQMLSACCDQRRKRYYTSHQNIIVLF